MSGISVSLRHSTGQVFRQLLSASAVFHDDRLRNKAVREIVLLNPPENHASSGTCNCNDFAHKSIDYTECQWSCQKYNQYSDQCEMLAIFHQHLIDTVPNI